MNKDPTFLKGKHVARCTSVEKQKVFWTLSYYHLNFKINICKNK